MAEEIQYTPLLPFNDLQNDNFIIYDNFTYVRDVALLDENTIRRHSPNMIKYYTTEMAPAIKIGGD